MAIYKRFVPTVFTNPSNVPTLNVNSMFYFACVNRRKMLFLDLWLVRVKHSSLIVHTNRMLWHTFLLDITIYFHNEGSCLYKSCLCSPLVFIHENIIQKVKDVETGVSKKHGGLLGGVWNGHFLCIYPRNSIINTQKVCISDEWTSL